MSATSIWIQFIQTGAAWLAAIGTISAASAAVWLGLRESVWRSQRRETDAAILTAFLEVEAHALIKQLQVVKQIHTSPLYMASLRSHETTLNFELARVYGTRPAMVGTSQFIIELGALGPDRAAAVSRTIGSLSTLHEALRMTAQEPNTDEDVKLIEVGLRESRKLINQMQSDLQLALKLSGEDFQSMISNTISGSLDVSERYKKLKAKYEP
ncbi:MAG: hypothetical protein KA735_04750 [Burkholderiaceae bacterium]|nr:hypothetical protein [Burkholderiaceae bacterium]